MELHLCFPPRQMVLWAMILPWTSLVAFQCHSVSMNPRLFQRGTTIFGTDIDISDVLAETEVALMLAQDSLPGSERIGEERVELSTLAAEQQRIEESRKQSIPVDDMIAMAIAHSVAEVGSSLSQQVEQATMYAQKHLNENDNDILKLPGSILSEVGSKAEENLRHMRKSQSQFVENYKSGQVFQDLVTFLKSDEAHKASSDFLDQTGQASLNTLKLVKAGLESDEAKIAKQKAMQAIRKGLESEKLKSLQSRAAEVIQEKLRSLKER
eukprot:scaffold1704_cov105-Cylindrotheca_fusiformis.AAC.2